MQKLKVYFANESQQTMGGGWTFLANIKKALKDDVEIVDTISACDIFFITSATMVQRERVMAAKELKKKIVLRIDNAPRNSRNRNTGTSRLKDFAEMADYVIYQSGWAHAYLDQWLKPKNTSIIINGVDTDIFSKKGKKEKKEGKPQCLYVRSSRADTKRWEEAQFQYEMIYRQNNGSHLWIVGPFSPEQEQYNFDFFMGEKYKYLGVIEDKERMAELYRATDILLLPFYNDACSNVLLEAKGCDVQKIAMNMTGGNYDIMSYAKTFKKVPDLEYMRTEYLKVFKELFEIK